jgi:hypothetical protein
VAEQPEARKSRSDEREGAKAKDSPRERRGNHRVADDQKSGQGSASALSKLKMIERKRAQLRIARDDDV